jgi:hypothetical protein
VAWELRRWGWRQHGTKGRSRWGATGLSRMALHGGGEVGDMPCRRLWSWRSREATGWGEVAARVQALLGSYRMALELGICSGSSNEQCKGSSVHTGH